MARTPHQSAAFYRDLHPPARWSPASQLQGKELSSQQHRRRRRGLGNASRLRRPACVIIKHANPCGVAVAARRPRPTIARPSTDPTRRFGGIIAFNRRVDGAAASARGQAVRRGADGPAFTAEALEVSAKVRTPACRALPRGFDSVGTGPQCAGRQARRLGLLIQTADNHELLPKADLRSSPAQPTAAADRRPDVRLDRGQYVKSNAIVFCGGGMTLGVGAGQMSRVDSPSIAAIKAANAGLRCRVRRSPATPSSPSVTAST